MFLRAMLAGQQLRDGASRLTSQSRGQSSGRSSGNLSGRESRINERKGCICRRKRIRCHWRMSASSLRGKYIDL